MVRVSMSVNGEAVEAEVEPRTQLADFLRNDLQLTGTHLGCEQGVCGACTVIVDGRMQRSCITFAADCEGADITTIEGFDDDPTMIELRDAFSEFHALQCGFCTPGMLATARDIVLRLGNIPESRIREELSGNICRCTGYVGIVEALKKVAAGKEPNIVAADAKVTVKKFDASRTAGAAVPEGGKAKASSGQVAPPAMATGQIKGGVSVEERIRVAATSEQVWNILSNLRRVVPCVPGAQITAIEGENLTGKVKIALGPIKASFSGQATVGMNNEKREGWMTGKGRDSGLGSSAEGAARWTVVDDDANHSVIAVTLTWKLSGALAQFNRAGLVQDIVRRLAATFAANLEATITGTAPPSRSEAPVGGFGLVWAVIKSKFSRSKAEVSEITPSRASHLVGDKGPISESEPSSSLKSIDSTMSHSSRGPTPTASLKGGVSIEEKIHVGASPDRVWEVLSDLRRVVPCIPGAEITTLEGENLTGKVKMALGPIKASFSGQATVGMNHAKREGWMSGKGRDSGLGSSAEGAVRWKVVDGECGGSDVVVALTWKLTGPLAQFNRAGLVQDIVRRLALTFAGNLESAIAGTAPPVAPGAALGAFGLIWAVIKGRFLRPTK